MTMPRERLILPIKLRKDRSLPIEVKRARGQSPLHSAPGNEKNDNLFSLTKI
jgi:hypothetical protein